MHNAGSLGSWTKTKLTHYSERAKLDMYALFVIHEMYYLHRSRAPLATYGIEFKSGVRKQADPGQLEYSELVENAHRPSQASGLSRCAFGCCVFRQGDEIVGHRPICDGG